MFTWELTRFRLHIRIDGAEPCGLGPVSTGENVMQRRRRFQQIHSLQSRLAEEAKRLREEAKLLPPGAVREAYRARSDRNVSRRDDIHRLYNPLFQIDRKSVV